MRQKLKKSKVIQPLKLDIGCGPNKKEGFTGVDQYKFPGVDVVCDLKKKWPFNDNTVDEIHCSHVIEHFTGVERCHIYNEMYRVMKVGAKASLIAPYWGSGRAYGDPTHCFSDDTDILMESGWKKISDVKVSERALTLCAKTSKTEYVPVIRTINAPLTGKMLHFKTVGMDLMVTPNHDLLWRYKPPSTKYRNSGPINKSPAESFIGLRGHHPRRGISVIPSWVGESPKTVTITKQPEHHPTNLPCKFSSEDYAEFVGWFVSEGWTETMGGHYVVGIGQSKRVNPDKYSEIVKLITRMGFRVRQFHDRIKFSSKDMALHLAGLGKSYQKYIPTEIKNLSPRLLNHFIDAACKGDGRSNGRSREYATTSRRLADDMQEIALKAGFRSSIYVELRSQKDPVQINNRSKKSKQRDMYIVGICPASNSWYPPPNEVDYNGNQVCVTVEKNHNILVRRNGRAIWAGNCWPPISDFSFYYLLKSWRAANAPHSDAEHWPEGYKCDFDATWGYSLNPTLTTRNQEYQQHAVTFFKEAVQDVIYNLVKRAP